MATWLRWAARPSPRPTASGEEPAPKPRGARVRAGAAACATALAACIAWPARADAPALAAKAGAQCESGDLEGAAASLRALVAELESRYGGGSDAAQIARMNLAHVERARGDAAEAARLEAPAGGGSHGKPDKALERALRKLRACAAVSPAPARELPRVSLSDRVNLARNQLNRGHYREARATARDAVASASGSAEPADLLRLYETLALVELQLGDAAAALRASAEAERNARRVGDVEVRITMARLAAQAGDYERAGRELDELSAAATSPKLRAELAEARGDLALRLGSPRQALEQLEPALAGHRKVYGPDSPSTAAVLHLRGDAYRLAGDFPAAMESYRKALDVRSRALGPRHAETARTRNAIGVLEADLGDWQEADRSFAAALEALKQALGPEHPEILTVRSNRALARWGAKPDAAAAEQYAQVVDALRRVLGDEHPSVAAAVRNLARMELDLGHAERAEALLETALAAGTRRLGADHPLLAPTRLARARLFAQRGELAGAAQEVDRAIATLSAERGAEHPTVIRARTLAARIDVARGADTEAFQQATLASRALASYTRRTFGAISDRQRALLAEDSQEVIGALLSVESAPPRELFVALLPHRDSVLRSIAAGHRREAGELASLRQRYVAAMLGAAPDSAARAGKIAARIDTLEAGAASGALPPERDPEDVLARACARLPADAALVKFAAFDRTRPGGRFQPIPAHVALVVRGGSCKVTRVQLADGDAVERPAEAFASAMREERADAPDARAALERELIEPLRPALSGSTRWLVIPDGALWGVPLGVLPDPESPGHYLLERVTIGYLTSTFELASSAGSRARSDDRTRAVLLGAPEFGSGAGGGPIVLTEAGPCQMPAFDALPATRQEIDDVASVVVASTTQVGADATKPQLEAALAGHPWLVHFATHAYFAGLSGCGTREAAARWREGESPIAPNPLLLSGIVLAGANDGGRIDRGEPGILTAYEVAGLDLSGAGLVVLSACDTGTGLQRRGQEVQGLRWGFRAAGARALVTSLWRSNDVATRGLMHAFYQALVEGDVADDAFRGAEALRRAQLAQVQNERRFGMQRPLTWANFVFSGVL